jgi:hypothetical protein
MWNYRPLFNIGHSILRVFESATTILPLQKVWRRQFTFPPRNVAVTLLTIFEACEVIEVRSLLSRCSSLFPPIVNAGGNSGL